MLKLQTAMYEGRCRTVAGLSKAPYRRRRIAVQSRRSDVSCCEEKTKAILSALRS